MNNFQTLSPIVETMQRIRLLASYVNVEFGVPTEGHWHHLPQLLADDNAIETWLATIRRANDTRDKHYQGMTLIGATWLPITAALSGLYTVQRVPDISPENVYLQISTHGFLDAVSLATTRYFALESDIEAQNDPDATLFPTFEALRDAVRQQIEAYAQPLIELAHRKTTLGKRAGWSTVADRCAQTIVTVLKMLGRSVECDEEVKAFIGESPMKGKTGVLWVEKEEVCEPFLRRGACCLSYKLSADHGYCSTCPLLTVAERQGRLRPYVSAS